MSEPMIDFETRGYRITARHHDTVDGQAVVEIRNGEGDLIESGVTWSYKVWTVAAHIDEILDRIERETPRPCLADPSRQPATRP